jgi:hypothetical protein
MRAYRLPPSRLPQSKRFNALRHLMITLLGINLFPENLALDLYPTDAMVDAAGSGVELHQESKYSSVLYALDLQKDCSNEMLECQGPGGLPDSTNPQCFSICVALETGCRSCCSDGECYEAPGNPGSLGSCISCQDGENNELCALLFTSCRKLFSSTGPAFGYCLLCAPPTEYVNVGFAEKQKLGFETQEAS